MLSATRQLASLLPLVALALAGCSESADASGDGGTGGGVGTGGGENASAGTGGAGPKEDESMSAVADAQAGRSPADSCAGLVGAALLAPPSTRSFGSVQYALTALARGEHPAPTAVRAAEFLEYFDAPTDGTATLVQGTFPVDLSTKPAGTFSVTVSAPPRSAALATPTHYVLVADASPSARDVRQVLERTAASLADAIDATATPSDLVSLVFLSSHAELAVDAVPAALAPAAIDKAFDDLSPAAHLDDDAYAGLEQLLGLFEVGELPREIVLLTDGGSSEPTDLVSLVEGFRAKIPEARLSVVQALPDDALGFDPTFADALSRAGGGASLVASSELLDAGEPLLGAGFGRALGAGLEAVSLAVSLPVGQYFTGIPPEGQVAPSSLRFGARWHVELPFDTCAEGAVDVQGFVATLSDGSEGQITQGASSEPARARAVMATVLAIRSPSQTTVDAAKMEVETLAGMDCPDTVPLLEACSEALTPSCCVAQRLRGVLESVSSLPVP